MFPKPVRIVEFAVVLSLLVCRTEADDTHLTDDVIRTAISKSLPLLEKGAKGSLEQSKRCFNCHNQGLPMMALVAARTRGFEIDSVHLTQQTQFVANFLTQNKEQYREGKGQEGQVDMAGYALWALDIGHWKPDDTTAAVAEYFLRRQAELEHWKPEARRPPAEQSFFTSTYVALRGLTIYGTGDQQERIEARIDRVRQWLMKTKPADTEDRVFRLRALQLIDSTEETLKQAATELIDTQHDDGGWAQCDDMSSDAYATGTALVALQESGGLTTVDRRYRHGLKYLISIQQDDGSWHVVSRSKPFQPYFESGYPHDTDQFISIAAASWSTTALALSLPKQADK